VSTVAPDKPRAAVDPARRPGEGRDPVSFPRYPKYKNSVVEWLGEVPAHWEVTNCRSLVEEQTAKNEGAKDQNYLSLMANVGVLPYEEKGDVGNKKPEDLTKCKLVSKGDFVINSMNYGIGSYGVSPYDGVCSPVYIVLRPRLDRIEPRFAFRLFENRAFQTHAQSFGNGILEHRAAISWDILKGIGVPVPPRAEQAAILRFLDRETAKIDALIAEQEKLIALLKEKRQALISNAVTQGLDPNAPMKDSGIEWLGQVPAHWDVARLGTIFREVSDVGAEDLPILSVSIHDGISDKELDEAEMDRKVTRSEDRSKYKAVQPGDLAYNMMRAWQGGFGAVMVAGQVSPAYVVARPIGEVCTSFIEQLLRTPQAVEQMRRHSRGVTDFRLRLYWEEFKNIRVALPPLPEQHAILDAAAVETTKFDSLVGEAVGAIELLKERRAALISATVTGKIDVRNAT